MYGNGYGRSYRRRKGVGNAVANAAAPTNYDYIWFTDSRGAFGQQSTVDANGYVQNDTYMSMFKWASRLCGYRIRPGLFPNYGLTGNSSTQMIANPRQNASNIVTTGYWYRPETVTGQTGASGNKGYVEVKAAKRGK